MMLKAPFLDDFGQTVEQVKELPLKSSKNRSKILQNRFKIATKNVLKSYERLKCDPKPVFEDFFEFGETSRDPQIQPKL